MNKVTVIGSCVCRDLFEKSNEFEFHTDIRFCSPISIMAKPVSFIHADNGLLTKKVKITNGKWYKKNLLNDLNKTFFEKISEDHGDWLIIDLAESRQKLSQITFKNSNEKLIVSNSVTFREHYTANLSKNILKDAELTPIDPLSYDMSLWEDTLYKFVGEIKKYFREDRIILIENYPISRYIDQNGLLKPYSTNNHLREIYSNKLLLSELYKIFKRICPTCHVVQMLSDCVGSQAHKWGNHPLHFTQTYYNYLLETITDIVKGSGNLESIYQKYSELQKNEFDNAIRKTASSFYLNKNYSLSYKELIENSEEFSQLGRKKKLLLLFAVDFKEAVKSLFSFFKQKRKTK